MNDDASDMIGDIADLQQTDEYSAIPIAPVPVVADGPIQVHQVPSVSGGNRSFPILVTDGGKRVANADLRRRSLTLISDQTFYIGETAVEASSRYGARWPANVPCRITHSEEVYVAVLVDGTVSVLSENWAN